MVTNLKTGKFVVSTLCVAVILLMALGTYVWQHNKVNRLNEQLLSNTTQLKGANNSNAVYRQRISDLSNQLNHHFTPNTPCQTKQLTLSLASELPGAAGNRYSLLSYTNISSTPCTIQGYPGFLALDNSGYVLPDGPILTGKNQQTPIITLSQDDNVYFQLHWAAQGVIQNQQCINTSLVESTPPGNIYPLVLKLNINDFCEPGISVSPLGPLSNFPH